METMKAISCAKYGPPEVLKIIRCEKPAPKEDEVLIRIRAASVTNSDIFIRSSKVPLVVMIPMRLMLGLRGPRKSIIGEVFSGEIEQTGSRITRFKPGDRVYGLTGFSLGAYAEFKCMKETDSTQGCLALMPGNITFEDATSAAYGGLLALQQLEKVRIVPGMKVLVYGASGTSGTIAVQYAKHLGAEVIGVCGAANIDFVKSLGADAVLDYTKDDSIQKIQQYDVVLDAVGKYRTSTLKKACMKALRDGGKIVSIDDGALLLDSGRLARITELVESNAVKPVTDKVFDFEDIVEAHRYVELGHKRGNVAVRMHAGAE